jgi:hypothetical protein
VGGELDDDDEAENRNIAHDRIIVENFFMRKKRLWRIAKDAYRGCMVNAFKLVTVTTWLTDLSVKWHPLRADAAEAPGEDD